MPSHKQTVKKGTSSPLKVKTHQFKHTNEPRYHYRCPDCDRRYFSTVHSNATCRHCSSNPQLVVDNRRKKTKANIDEVNLDLPINNRVSRRLAPSSLKEKTYVFAFETKKEAEDEVKAYDVDNDLDDTNYEPPARDPFNISMRLTSGQSENQGRRDSKVVDALINPFWTKPAKGMIGAKQNRPTTTGSVMGAAIKGKGTLSAANASKRGTKFYPGSKTHQEWCHLVGDSLGGPTSAENLVAGSYGANTYMCAIEKMLIGNTAVHIEITAYCSTAHIAERIVYTMSTPKSSNTYTFTIDAMNNNFTQSDMEGVQKEVSDWLKSVGV
jgi:hypothetical protein